MEKFHASILSTIIACILLVPASVLTSSAACVTYSSSTSTITVSCTSSTHLTDINSVLNNPTILKRDSDNGWILAANLIIAKTANGVIDSSDTIWLKIISDGTAA